MGNRKEHDEKTVRGATSLKKETVPKRVVGSKIAKTLLTLFSYLFTFLRQLYKPRRGVWIRDSFDLQPLIRMYYTRATVRAYFRPRWSGPGGACGFCTSRARVRLRD